MIKFDLHKILDAAEGSMNLDIKLEIERGQFVTIFGPSGAGKTSILRMLTGLMSPDSGYVEVNGESWFSDRKQKRIQDRSVGYLFQDYALFPNMTVRQNLNYALPKGESNEIINELLNMIQIGQLQDRKPETLSGGQKQRVALARTLVRRPQLLLLDEPLSALDFEMRQKLQGDILDLHRRFNLTTILVSHDLSEILRLSDHVVELNHGQVIRQGRPLELFGGSGVTNKFQFTGNIVAIDPQETIYIVSVLIGNQIVKVIASTAEANEFNIGDRVMVASKAFNPMIRKI